MKKITLATIKSFIKKNQNNLYVKASSRFDGMTDGVENVQSTWKKVERIDMENNNTYGIPGAWFVGSSRDYFQQIENGFYICNCCGSFSIIAA